LSTDDRGGFMHSIIWLPSAMLSADKRSRLLSWERAGWDRYRTHDLALHKPELEEPHEKPKHSIATDQLRLSSRCRVLAFLPFCSAYLFARNCPVRADEPDLPLLVHSMMTSPQGMGMRCFHNPFRPDMYSRRHGIINRLLSRSTFNVQRFI
jgi:hypothetical protein